MKFKVGDKIKHAKIPAIKGVIINVDSSTQKYTVKFGTQDYVYDRMYTETYILDIPQYKGHHLTKIFKDEKLHDFKSPFG